MVVVGDHERAVLRRDTEVVEYVRGRAHRTSLENHAIVNGDDVKDSPEFMSEAVALGLDLATAIQRLKRAGKRWWRCACSR